MAKGGSGGSGSSWLGLLGVLLVVGLIIQYWYVIVGVALLVGMVFLASHLWEERAKRGQLAAAQDAALCARADYEHQQFLRGDPRGLYGQFQPPPL